MPNRHSQYGAILSFVSRGQLVSSGNTHYHYGVEKLTTNILHGNSDIGGFS